ncbi:MAG: hypothetical protein Q4D76_17630 [Oscillospiraceae bacterium]|nr:hypothetical protein [Oscillospiraceae bacterium]
MMENKVALTFSDNIVCLAGFEYGKEEFLKQAKDKLNPDKEFYVEFPPQIVSVASSFVNGFFEEFVEKVGLSAVEKRIHILGSEEGMEKDIRDKLIFGYSEGPY